MLGSCGRKYATEAEAGRSKRALNGSAIAVPCRIEGHGWHLASTAVIERRAKAAAAPAKAAADTGPDRRTRALVLDRDGYACARCGKPCGPGIAPYSLQHRVARGVGGDSRMSNLVLLDGTATTGCHGEVESKRYLEDQDKGYRLESWQDPRMFGVLYFEADGSGVTLWLEDNGGVLHEPPAEAREVA